MNILNHDKMKHTFTCSWLISYFNWIF